MSVRTVGAGAGFAGDRVEPAVALAASGRCNAVVLECLAERTLVRGLAERRQEPARGYDPRLRRRLEPLLPVAAEQGCAIVTNLGSANPAAAAEAIHELAGELGIAGLKVAAVLGDDVLDEQLAVSWEQPAPGQLIGAYVYLGAEAIARALAEGADVIVTGRVADASLFVGPLHAILRDEDALAGATAVGHLLECSGQLTGGNYEAPGAGRGADTVSSLVNIGYPLASVEPDGTALITKLDGTGGVIDRLTCTLQLLYEVHDPNHYITPDAIVDFSRVEFRTVGDDRIAVSGARFVGVPETLKVVGFVRREGVIADLEIAYAGRGARKRAYVAAEILRQRLDAAPGLDQLQVDLVGVDSVLRAASRPVNGDLAEVRVHASAICENTEVALAAEDEVYGLTLTGPAGGCCIRSERREPVEVVTGRIARDQVDARIQWANTA